MRLLVYNNSVLMPSMGQIVIERGNGLTILPPMPHLLSNSEASFTSIIYLAPHYLNLSRKGLEHLEHLFAVLISLLKRDIPIL